MLWGAIGLVCWNLNILTRSIGVSGVGADVQEVKRGVTGLHTKFDSSQLNDLMNWLGPLQFLSQQEMMLKNRAPTGEWLVKTAAFKRWVKGTSWQLRCHGEAGIGKVRRSYEA